MHLSTNKHRGQTAMRTFIALGNASGVIRDAIAYTEAQPWPDREQVVASLKASVNPIDTQSGAPLITPAGFDYAEFLRPQTARGKILGFRNVPPYLRLISGTGGASASWVGEKNPKPVSAAAFAGGDVMEPLKITSTVVTTKELLRFSAPNAESTLSADMSRAGAEQDDVTFLDPANAGTPGVKPASISYGAPTIPLAGDSIAAIDSAGKAAIGGLVSTGSTLNLAQWVMHTRTATELSSKRDPNSGMLAYPGLTVRGGFFLGLPVVTTGNLPVSNETGNPTSIILLDASEILMVDDGATNLSVARHASIAMETEPASPAQQVSLWQLDLVALRAERMANWRRRRDGVVQVITDVIL